MAEPLLVPEAVRSKAIAADLGWWIGELPDLVAELGHRWELTTGSVLGSGTESLVLEAHLADGRPAILKLLLPQDPEAIGHEITVLQLADGSACPTLYRHDRPRAALLMERLGPPLSELGLPAPQRHAILCAAAARLWRPAPAAGLPTGAEKARWLSRFISDTWDAVGRPCSERVVEQALACARRREAAHDDEGAVLVHGDVHEWNTLQSGDGFKLVDPDGLLAEAEYDLGIIMREDPIELLDEGAWARAHRLAALTGLDPTATWEWGVIERVSTGLLCTSVDIQPAGRQMLRAAEVVAEREAAAWRDER